MTIHARTFISAAAGLAVGAILTLLAGPWALAAQNASQVPAARYQDTVLTDAGVQRLSATRTVPARTTFAAPRTSTQRIEKKQDWAKTALIIGGSAGAGAGIGAMAKGKKGALIGAAIGGGAAALVEAIRR